MSQLKTEVIVISIIILLLGISGYSVIKLQSERQERKAEYELNAKILQQESERIKKEKLADYQDIKLRDEKIDSLSTLFNQTEKKRKNDLYHFQSELAKFKNFSSPDIRNYNDSLSKMLRAR